MILTVYEKPIKCSIF